MRFCKLVCATALGLVALPVSAAVAAQEFPSVPAPAGAHSELVSTAAVAPDTTRYSYRYGPLVAAPGQNLVLVGPVTIERPAGAGYITRVKPDLIAEDGNPPPVEQVHMHHAVFFNLSHPDVTAPQLPQRFGGFAEEKTIGQFPAPYGYPLAPSDVIGVNYMLHNETTQTRVVWITYDMDWASTASPTGLAMKPARPLWLDVENGKAYPVFDVNRGSGHDGLFTYPNEKPDAYAGGPRRNEWTVDHDGTLVVAAGHLHPGGLWVNLDVARGGQTAQAFRSNANYFDPGGPVSWDMAMDMTPSDWRVGLKKGDVLRVSTTYDSARASWYESMGIMLAFMVDDTNGPDPFTQPIDRVGAPTHGHLPEDGNYGGKPTGLPDAGKLPDGGTIDNGVGISDFAYLPGDLSLSGGLENPPLVARGDSLRFGNFDASASILHTITACRQPCNGSTGVSYPLANGSVQFDSGQLGYGPDGYTAAAQRPDWYTPTNLPAGTYTYFCRVHPFMRGSFRVSGTPAPSGQSGSSSGSGARSGPPAISIVSKSLRLDRRGRVPVKLRCNGSGGTCRGTLRLAAVRKRKVLSLGTARFALRAGRTATVRLTLPKRRRGLVRRLGRLPVLARARPAGGGAMAARTLVLRARR